MIDNRIAGLQSHNRDEELFLEQEKMVAEKCSFVLKTKTDIIKNLINNNCDEDTYKSCVNEDWLNFLFGKMCAEYVFKQNDLDYYEFIKWFKKFDNKYLSVAYIKTLEKYLKNAKYLNNYLKKLDNLISNINKNMLNKEYIWERYIDNFDNILKEWDSNKTALNILEKRSYSEEDYWHSNIVFYSLYPLRNYELLGKILEKFQYIHPIQYILNFPMIKTDMEILCQILKSSPIIKESKKTWNKNKVALITIKYITQYLENLYQISNNNEKNFKEETDTIISKIIEIINKRADSNFILQIWLLYLTKNICSLNTYYQKMNLILIELISKHIPDNKIFRQQLIKNNQNVSTERLIVILILIAPDYIFPKNYLKLFIDYLTDLNNRIYTGGYKNDPIQLEHRIISQLFYKGKSAIKKWNEIWNNLYKERRVSYCSHFNNTSYSIDHSIYLVLVGLAACEYYFYENKDVANKFLGTIWNCLFEIYLDQPIEISKEIITSSMSRIIILQSRLGFNINEKLNLIQNNSSLLLDIVNNLLNNNVDMQFIKNNKIMLSKIHFSLMINKDDKQLNDHYEKVEKFING
mgnify:CR=1 FL=1